MDNKSINVFELHYFLSDNSHAMDALVRHKCESELIKMVNIAARIFQTEIILETEAYREGGLKEFWKIVSTNKLLVTILPLLLCGTGYLIQKYLPETAYESQKHELELEHDKLENQKLKYDILTTRQKDALDIKSKQLENETAEIDLHEKISKSQAINRSRSNFYKHLVKYPKVTDISVQVRNDKGESLHRELFINYSHFNEFILHEDKEESITVINNMQIDIISPVLKSGGKYKWSGIYQNEVISFTLSDADFKQKVINKQITFTSGSFIICNLEIIEKTKYDEIGNIAEPNLTYKVIEVISYGEGSVITSLPKKNKKTNAPQLDLFDH